MGFTCEVLIIVIFVDHRCNMIECQCDISGTVPAQKRLCEKQDGKCKCKSNYSGHHCTECSAGFYSFPDCVSSFVSTHLMCLQYVQCI